MGKKYEVQSPDGKIFEVEAPDGATEQEVLAYAQSQFQKPAPSGMDKAMGIAKRVAGMNPLGGLVRGAAVAGEALDKAAYDAGGYVTDKAAGMGASPEFAAGLGYVGNVATQAIPTVLSGPITKAITAPLGEPVGRYLMQSAMKPSVQHLATDKAGRAAETMLKEGLNVTPGGMAELQQKIGKIGSVIDNTLSMSPATVDKKAVAGRLHDALARVEKQVSPNADVKVVEKAWQEFLEHPLLAGSDAIPVKLANQIKQGTYKAIGGKHFGEIKGAEIEAQKALARGLKEEVAKAVPGVVPLNKQQGDLLNALNVAERRAALQGNNNPAGLALLAENTAAGVGFAADRSALIKSLLARLSYSGAVPSILAQGGTGLYMKRGALYPEE